DSLKGIARKIYPTIHSVTLWVSASTGPYATDTSNEAATRGGIMNQARTCTRRALLASSQARRLATRWLRESVTKPTVQTGGASTGTRRDSLTNAAARSTASQGLETAASSA